MHPGLGDTASREIDNGWRVRHSDLEFLISPEALDAVRQEGIVIIDYREIKDSWSQQWPHEQAAYGPLRPPRGLLVNGAC